MKNRLKYFFILAAAFFLCAAPAFAETVLNRGASVEPQTLDPHKASLVQEAALTWELFEGLATYNAKGEIVPGVAESWTTSGDGKVYTFKLRADAKWSNGEPVTANDFVYGWRRVVDPKTGSYYASMLYVVKNGEAINKGGAQPETLGVRAVDDKTFEVTLNGPTLYFTETLAHPATCPVHRATIEKFGADWVKPGNMVGNGAFVLKDFIPKEKITLAKNPAYRDAAQVKIDTVNYIALEDRGAALKRFEAGEIDTYDDLPVEQMSYIREKFAGQFLTGPYLGTYFFWFKNDKPPFDNAKLRRAMALAIDREYIADKIWAGTMTAAYSFVPPGIVGYDPVQADFKAMTQVEREDEAKKLMAELGYGPDKPLSVELRFNTSENHRNTAIAVADMLKTIGIEAKLLNTDGKTHYGHLRSHGDFDLARANWVGDYRDPQTFLLIPTTGDGHNYGLYSNKAFDALVAQADIEGDIIKRREIMMQAEKIIVQEQPLLILLHYRSKNLVSARLQGWETNNIDAHLSRWLAKN